MRDRSHEPLEGVRKIRKSMVDKARQKLADVRTELGGVRKTIDLARSDIHTAESVLIARLDSAAVFDPVSYLAAKNYMRTRQRTLDATHQIYATLNTSEQTCVQEIMQLQMAVKVVESYQDRRFSKDEAERIAQQQRHADDDWLMRKREGCDA